MSKKTKENNNLAINSYRFTWSLWEKTPRNCKFTFIALIGHKRAGNFELAILVQNSMRNYELLKIIVFGRKSKEKITTWQNILTVPPESCAEKGAQL